MIKIIIILLILFLLNNFYFKENFSNSYQDAELSNKMMIEGTNIEKHKVLLTLYYDRREINCKYFYDYFSINFGGENFEVQEATVEPFTNSPSPTPSHSLPPPPPPPPPPTQQLPTAPPLRFVENIQFSGENQAWNLIKQLYANQTDPFINPLFMNIEEVEVDQFNLSDFNNVYAHKLIDSGVNVGKVQYLGDGPRNYKQFLRPNDFLPKIPFITLTLMKHKGKNEMEEILENNAPASSGTWNKSSTYESIKKRHLNIYDIITVKYEGIYSPNNRAIESTVDNIKNFVKDSCEKYLETSSTIDHQNRIDGGETPSFLGTTTHTLTQPIPSSSPVINKCRECSEFEYTSI